MGLKSIVRKFVDSISLDNWQVLGDQGYSDVLSIKKTIKYDEYKVVDELGNSLFCADNHLLIHEDDSELFAKDSMGKKVKTTKGTRLITNVVKTGKAKNMYDLELSDESNHLYYTNEFLSHNTTTYTIYLLWLTMFHSEKKVMILANKLDTALEIMDRIRLAYQYIPSYLKPTVLDWNKGEVKFGNLSVIKGLSTASDAARGTSANVVIIDEAAFIPNNIASKVFESIYPVISSSKNSQFIMVSTPNGADPNNLYYETWQKAISKVKDANTEGWKAFRFDWWDVPGRDEEWKRNTIASIGEKRFAQEFGNEFLASDTMKKLVPDDVIERFRMRLSQYKKDGTHQGKDIPIFSKDGKKTYTVRMYHEFNPQRTYLVSSDVAEGIGKDSSVLYVWDVTDLSNVRMCLSFADNQISILEFAYLTNEVCKMYNNPYLACESNGIALGYIEQLRITYEYENFVRMNRDNGCGIQSHVQVKSRACLWFRDMLTTVGFDFQIYDLALVDEMGTFVKKDTRVQNVFAAVGDNHDDHLITMIWACWILNPDNVEKYYQVGDEFTTALGNVYPKRLEPMFEYTEKEIAAVMSIPAVRDFLTFKELHKDEYDEDERIEIERQRKTAEMLGSQTVVTEQPKVRTVESQMWGDENENADVRVVPQMRKTRDGRTIYSQESVMDRVFGSGRQKAIQEAQAFLGSTGSGFGESGGQAGTSGLFGFDDQDLSWN